MSKILALNRHWNDVLLDYSPRKLSIYVDETSDKFIDGVKQESLNGLKFFHLNGLCNKDGFAITCNARYNSVTYRLYDTARKNFLCKSARIPRLKY